MTDPRAGSGRGVRGIAALLSLLGGLGAAEAGAAWWRGGAYPLLNVFVADAAQGVRLRPSSETRLRSRQGRITTVALNELGYRGRSWTPADEPGPVPGRILLLGDSQMFGFGVEEPLAIAAQLERVLGPGHEVLDAAVPTWGPAEYGAALAELGPVYRPATVVWVGNAANDWFEWSVPNRARTSARDGWAVRQAGPGAAPLQFPGREWLLSRSQLVLAWRELWAAATAGALPPALAAHGLAEHAAAPPRPYGPYRSPLGSHLEAARSLAERVGADVVALALPLDVQVDPREWAKYRDAPVDLRATEGLLRAFLADARALGLAAVDGLTVLRDASPGAFLPDDYHLSPRGHTALAQALAAVIGPQSAALEARR